MAGAAASARRSNPSVETQSAEDILAAFGVVGGAKKWLLELLGLTPQALADLLRRIDQVPGQLIRDDAHFEHVMGILDQATKPLGQRQTAQAEATWTQRWKDARDEHPNLLQQAIVRARIGVTFQPDELRGEHFDRAMEHIVTTHEERRDSKAQVLEERELRYEEKLSQTEDGSAKQDALKQRLRLKQQRTAAKVLKHSTTVIEQKEVIFNALVKAHVLNSDYSLHATYVAPNDVDVTQLMMADLKKALPKSLFPGTDDRSYKEILTEIGTCLLDKQRQFQRATQDPEGSSRQIARIAQEQVLRDDLVRHLSDVLPPEQCDGLAERTTTQLRAQWEAHIERRLEALFTQVVERPPIQLRGWSLVRRFKKKDIARRLATELKPYIMQRIVEMGVKKALAAMLVPPAARDPDAPTKPSVVVGPAQALLRQCPDECMAMVLDHVLTSGQPMCPPEFVAAFGGADTLKARLATYSGGTLTLDAENRLCSTEPDAAGAAAVAAQRDAAPPTSTLWGLLAYGRSMLGLGATQAAPAPPVLSDATQSAIVETRRSPRLRHVDFDTHVWTRTLLQQMGTHPDVLHLTAITGLTELDPTDRLDVIRQSNPLHEALTAMGYQLREDDRFEHPVYALPLAAHGVARNVADYVDRMMAESSVLTSVAAAKMRGTKPTTVLRKTSMLDVSRQGMAQAAEGAISSFAAKRFAVDLSAGIGPGLQRSLSARTARAQQLRFDRSTFERRVTALSPVVEDKIRAKAMAAIEQRVPGFLAPWLGTPVSEFAASYAEPVIHRLSTDIAHFISAPSTQAAVLDLVTLVVTAVLAGERGSPGESVA